MVDQSAPRKGLQKVPHSAAPKADRWAEWRVVLWVAQMADQTDKKSVH